MVLNERELKIIRIWGDTVIHGGHWGDGDVIFPDEHNLLHVLEDAVPGEDIRFSPRNLEILRIWTDSNTGTPEEDHLVIRITEAMKAAELNQ